MKLTLEGEIDKEKELFRIKEVKGSKKNLILIEEKGKEN